VLLGDAPDPFGPIPQHDDLLRPCEAAPDGLGINTGAEALRRFDRPQVGGGFLIPYRLSLLLHLRLGEYTPELGLPRLGLAGLVFALVSFGLPPHHRHPARIDRHLQLGYPGLAQER